MAASAYHVVSTEIENHKIEFLDTYVFINNPHGQSVYNISGYRIIIFLCKYYIVIADTLIGSSWMCPLCCWL